MAVEASTDVWVAAEMGVVHENLHQNIYSSSQFILVHMALTQAIIFQRKIIYIYTYIDLH